MIIKPLGFVILLGLSISLSSGCDKTTGACKDTAPKELNYEVIEKWGNPEGNFNGCWPLKVQSGTVIHHIYVTEMEWKSVRVGDKRSRK